MKSKLSERDKYLVGSVLFLAMLIGGGSSSGLYTDSILQVVAVIASAIVLSTPGKQRIDRRALWLLAAIVALCLFQLVPLPASVIDRFRPALFAADFGLPADGPPRRFVSLGVGRTLECVLYVAAAGGFFLAVSKLRPEQVYALLPFFFMGVICNALAGAIQYSLADNVEIEGFLPYTITAGLFGNVNHFSALLFVSIPFIVFHGLFRGNPISGILGLIGVLLLLLAAGSRAGVLIGLAITLISVLFLNTRSQLGRLSILVLFIALSVYTVGAWSKVSTEALDPDFGRSEFAQTTIEGIRQNWPFGVGFGNFQKAYQIYEHENMIFRLYVNHAHNDYLELVFEGGIAAAALIVVYLGMVLFSVFRIQNSAFQKAAFLAICFLLVHSLVDYPLRTMALTLSFAFMNAILFHTGIAPRLRKEAERDGESRRGQIMAAPVDPVHDDDGDEPGGRRRLPHLV